MTISIDPLEAFLPWSVVVADLGGLQLVRRPDSLVYSALPSSRQAAEYVASFYSAFDLGRQCSAALAAVLCFRVHRETRILLVPRPKLSSSPRYTKSRAHSSVPPEFHYLRRYMIIGLSIHVIPVVLESLMWEPSVLCSYAGHWIRLIRRLLGPAIEAGDRELLAKTIAFASAKSSPLWLGVLICGDYPRLLNAIDYYHWNSIWTVDAAAWTGIPRSFLALQPTGPHLQNGSVSRSDVWRLRRDLRDLYEEDDYVHKPIGPFRPFGTIRFEDIEPELQQHLRCSHQ
ncbi:hypothetical protein IMZ48_41185 [Candidatus Bathyarchaeota archaeon]|nr:hypothetical protein [Candidatus Bathyarchaeota archaeon]